MFAGHHTSAGTTAWILIEMLRHPEILISVTEEIDALFGADGEVTFESLREIPKLENVIKEVLRLHPPLIILMRKVLVDLHYRDYTIEAGKLVCIAPPVSHRIPSIFPDPDHFDPGRYEEGREEDATPFAWIAFGGGKHKCSGNAFALLQIKAIFVILLRHYTFELVDPPESYVDDYEQMVVQPRNPAPIRFRRRSDHAGSGATQAARGTEAVAKQSADAPVAKQLKVEIDWPLCQGHAVCQGEAPEIFKVDEGGQLSVLLETPPVELHDKLRRAERYCPTRAIKVVET